jgi:hypothetical protein
MNLSELKAHLNLPPDVPVAIELPDGDALPAHFHVTEIGHVAKRFVDCGGKVRSTETCVLQTWAASPRDDGHRLTVGKLNAILAAGGRVLPTEQLPVEVEFEAGEISQYPLERIAETGTELRLHLGRKHTDCLAKERCGADNGTGGIDGEFSSTSAAAGSCCAATAGGKCCA